MIKKDKHLGWFQILSGTVESSILHTTDCTVPNFWNPIWKQFGSVSFTKDN